MLALLAKVPLRWWIYIGAAIAIAGLLAHDHLGWHLAKARKAEVTQISAKLTAKQLELDTERHNAQLARESSNAYQQALEDLRAARADTPARVVRLCRGTTAVLPGAAGGSAAAGEGAVQDSDGSDLEAGPDIGGPLYGLADEADECAVQRDALIDWFRRTAPASR